MPERKRRKKHPLDAAFAPNATRLQIDCLLAELNFKSMREKARRRARGEQLEEEEYQLPKELRDKGPALLTPPGPDDSELYRDSYHHLLAEHMVAPRVDEPPMPRTPHEWREEHLRWMALPGVAELYDDKETPDQLEATTYWDYCHGRFIPMCPACLMFRPIAEFRLTQQNKCRHCQHERDGREWVRASYLLLLGERHPDFGTANDPYEAKENVFRFLAHVYGAREGEFTDRVYVNDDGEPGFKYGPEAMLADYEYCCSEEKVRYRRANAKALALFRKLFGKRKYDRFVNYGEMWVDGADGRQYRLFYSRHGNVAVYDPSTRRQGVKWRPVAAYCGHFGEAYPVVDQVIAQALMFRTDPQRYISQANPVEGDHMRLVGPHANYYEEMKEALVYA